LRMGSRPAAPRLAQGIRVIPRGERGHVTRQALEQQLVVARKVARSPASSECYSNVTCGA